MLICFSIAFIVLIFFWKTHGSKGPRNVSAKETASASGADAEIIRALVSGEETYLKLMPKMRALSEGLRRLQLPAPGTENIFAPSVSIRDIGPSIPAAATVPILENSQWPLANSPKQEQGVALWRPLFEAIDHFEHAEVFIINGRHPGNDMFHYEANGGFDALAKMKSGEWRSFSAKMRLHWQRPKIDNDAAGEWQITTWNTEEMSWSACPQTLFAESLDQAIRGGAQEAAKLRHSQHYQALLNYYREGMKTLPHPYFSPISVNQKEGLAIADVNGDGFDDIYITVRLGKNMLLVNQKDGTFIEQAAEYKLDLPGHTTCALFAEFDNDGDLDVMLGRSLLKTTYLENRGGHYYQHPIPSYMPMAVISMAAADFNGLGLRCKSFAGSVCSLHIQVKLDRNSRAPGSL